MRVPSNSEHLGIADLAARTGLSAHTLRYYERAGLISAPPRGQDGRRRYAPEVEEWVRFLTYLRATGMPIRSLRRYAELVHAGPETVPDRLQVLEEHQARVRSDLLGAERARDAIERKVAFYRQRVLADGGSAVAPTGNGHIWNEYGRLFRSKRLDEWAQLWTEDGRFVVVYPLPGTRGVIEGRDALAATFGRLAASIGAVTFTEEQYQPTADPEVVWVEYHIHIDLLDGGTYDNEIASRLTFRDGLLAELKEYYGFAQYEAFAQRLSEGAPSGEKDREVENA